MKIPGLLIAAPAIAVLAFTRAAALPAADTSEVRAYTLTEADIAKLALATKALREANFGTCITDTDSDDDAEQGAYTLALAAARIDAEPTARAALQSAGMTSRELVVVVNAIVQDRMAAYMAQMQGGKVPPGFNPANVAFVSQHWPEIQRLEDESDEVLCEGDDG